MLQKLRDLYARLQLRTLATAAGVIVLGVLDVYDVIDIQGIVSLFVEDEIRVGKIVAVIGLVFAVLRLITRTAVLSPSKDDEQ